MTNSGVSTGIDAVAVARRLVDAAGDAIDAAVAHAAEVTDGGAAIDDHQVHTERIAYLATQVRAAGALVASSEGLREAGVRDEQQEDHGTARPVGRRDRRQDGPKRDDDLA